ncbi:uncharacterized protein LOC144653984 [Oculina patagonica]
MKTERQRRQKQNKGASNSTSNGGQCDNRTEASRQDIENGSTSEASYSFADGSLLRSQHCHVDRKIKEDNSIYPAKSIYKQSGMDNEMASGIDSLDILFDGTWRSPTSPNLASVSDVFERKLSSESMDSDILNSSLDFAPSLDDVFDVIDEMDSFEPGLHMNAPMSTPSTHVTPQIYRCSSLYQLPSCSHPCNSFQGFNFGLVKGLQNPSRGIITAMRRLCELLSKPRSDHLESVFVRLLNSTVTEMEDATQPQFKRPRRNNERLSVPYRQRKRPNKSASDAERSFESGSRSITSKSQSLPAISTRADRCTESVDLTGLEKSEKEQQQDSKESQKNPFIALEDTMSAFMSSLSNIAAKQES